jgi:hypothetical protein
MTQLIGTLLAISIVAGLVISFFIPNFWRDSDESPFDGLSPRVRKFAIILYLVLFVLIGAMFYLGIKYEQLQSESAAAAYPTPVIHITATDAAAITNNFNQMCEDLTFGEWQAVFADLTPALQSQVGTAAQIPYMIGGPFQGGYNQAANCSPDDTTCGNQLTGAFVFILASPDANHAVFCGDVSPEITSATVGTYNVRSFAYVRTDAGWKIAAIQTLSRWGT